MNNEGFEEWDASFLEQVIQVEELALSSTNPTQYHHPPPPQFHLAPPYSAASFGDVSYSPPQELSQRVQNEPIKRLDHSSNGFTHSLSAVPAVQNTSAAPNANDQEIDSLKRELGRLSEQLTHLERECLDLRKERDKKEENFRSVFSRLEAKDAEVLCRKSANFDVSEDYGVHHQDYPAVPPGCKDLDTSNHPVGCQINVARKAIGVQTDIAVESTDVVIKNDVSTSHQCSRKLLGIWDSTFDQQTGRNLVLKLFVACETDFHVLFGYLNSNSSSKTTVDSLSDGYSSDVLLQCSTQPARSAETVKLSHFYHMLTKNSNGMVKLEALLEAVVDLCCPENVVIVCRSLHILHMVLSHLLSIERKSERRNYVMVEGPTSENNISQIYGSMCSEKRSLFHGNAGETPDAVIDSFNAATIFKKKVRDQGSTSTTGVDRISLFELMQQIIMQNHDEHARLEAVSIMNMILMRSNAYLEREKYGEGIVFQSVSRLLRKEVGFSVQKQALHLVYLLLNCPKIMSIFCSGYKEELKNAGAAKSDATNASGFQQFSEILEGLADCVSCYGNGTQGLQLRRNATTLLAFLASSGKSGIEILLSHKLSKGTNFFALILQMVVSEMDVEALHSILPSEIFKERTLLIREALIFLNRLVSNAQYSGPVLRVLTNSRDVAFLTIDIATRLSRKGKWLWQSDTMTRQIRELEIVNLARVFKKRVFNFLGDSIS